MRGFKTFIAVLLCMVLMLGVFTNVVMGDWDPGDGFKMHFPQMPNPMGWDIAWFSPQDYTFIELADDWKCSETGPVSDIHFWLSWRHDIEGPLDELIVRIYSDNPSGPGGYSQPGELLWEQTFSQSGIIYRPYGQGDQGWCNPMHNEWIRPDHQKFFQININMQQGDQPFIQQEGTIYWLSVLVRSAGGQEVTPGWKTSQDHWNDCAVFRPETGVPSQWNPIEVSGEHIDLSFVITTPDKMDFGDAPDDATGAAYPTLLASNGARHKIVQGVYLGAGVDHELDGQPDPQALGDDNDGNDDEDGVVFTSPLTTGQSATVDVTASVDGVLFAWVDFNANGNWADMGEQIFNGTALTAGVNHLTFNVPAAATLGNTFARFRFITGAGMALNYDGPANNGEVEDYQVTIVEKPHKWKQPPDLTPTGMDVQATEPVILADDFLCRKRGLITEITVWGSWYHDYIPFEEWPEGVTFTLSLHEDIPDPNVNDPTTFSQPGKVVWVKRYEPGSYTARVEEENIYEGWWDPSVEGSYEFPGDHICWKYTFQVPPEEAFCQQGDPNRPVVYWLDVQAVPEDRDAVFGWKSSSRHWNDDAVWGMGMEPYNINWNEMRYPRGHPLMGKSVDLAFVIDSEAPCPKPIADLGDAPDSTNSWLNTPMDAYPPIMAWPNPPIIRSARYPTVYKLGSPPYGPIHWQPRKVAWLGKNVTLEREADIQPDQDGINNIDPPANKANLDKADDGVLAMPLILPNCTPATFDYIVNVVDPNVDLYVNVWFDWTRDGDWNDWPQCMYSGPPMGPPTTEEWAVQNQLLPSGTLNVGLNTVTSLPFTPWPPAMKNGQPIWMRITLAEIPVPVPVGKVITTDGGAGPASGYQYGETEDYYFVPRQPCSGCADLNCDGFVDLADFVIFASQWLHTCP